MKSRDELGALFEPIHIGSKRIKNRIVMPAMGTLFATWDGRVTDRLIEHYRERARGGAGLIVVEYAYVHRSGQVYNGQLAVDRDDTIPGLARLAAAIKKEGATAALQLVHGGRICFPEVTGATPLSPSPLATVGGAWPRAVSREEIALLEQAFAEAAGRVGAAGFDIVELHMTHGYLIHSFLTPLANQRTDSYGGDLANRARFALETLGKARAVAGDGVEITAKIPGSDYLDGGLTIDEVRCFAQWLEQGGAAALTVSGGLKNETDQMVTPPMSVPRGFRAALAEKVKEAVAIPVATVGRVNDPFLAADIISNGQADLVATGRALLADPHWPRKAIQGLTEQIRPCIACNQGCIGRIMAGLPITCLANPAVGRERRFRLKAASLPKTVAVAGGGPGGMTAASTLAQRGHKVVLIEKSGALGGRLAVAALPPFKAEIASLLDYLGSEIDRRGVEVRLKTPLSRNILEEIAPDFVLLACGAKIVPPNLDGIGLGGFVFAEDAIRNPAVVGDRVAVVGGGLVGLEAAEVILDEGKSVIVLEMADQLAQDLNERERKLKIARLWSKEIDLIPMARFLDYRADEKTIVLDRRGITEHLEGIDTIVWAGGYQSQAQQLLEIVEPLGLRAEVIGDALAPRSALEAIREGFEFGFRL